MNTRDVINLVLSFKRKQFTQKTKIKNYNILSYKALFSNKMLKICRICMYNII